MDKEVKDGSFRRTEGGIAHDDDGSVLRPYKQRILPQSATVNRASIVLDECSELPVVQKRRTQFLSSNYTGEMAVMPGAWALTGSDENVTGDELLYLADPKPDVEKKSTSDSAAKDEKNQTENKQGGFDKGTDDRNVDRFSNDEKSSNQVRHK
eukprot:gene13258-15275_t